MKKQDRYRVVINHEEQFDIWPLDRRPSGEWRDAGVTGSGPECLSYVQRMWQKMPAAEESRLKRIIGRS